MLEVLNGKVLVNKKQVGTINSGGSHFSSYIRMIRSEENHTFWKFKAWGINKELVNFSLKYKIPILIVATHKSKELSNYFISCDEIMKFIEKYECEFNFKGEVQYVIPKTFFHYKRENEAMYSNPTYVTTLHTKRFAIAENSSEGQSAFIS